MTQLIGSIFEDQKYYQTVSVKLSAERSSMFCSKVSRYPLHSWADHLETLRPKLILEIPFSCSFSLPFWWKYGPPFLQSSTYLHIRNLSNGWYHCTMVFWFSGTAEVLFYISIQLFPSQAIEGYATQICHSLLSIEWKFVLVKFVRFRHHYIEKLLLQFIESLFFFVKFWSLLCCSSTGMIPRSRCPSFWDKSFTS